MTKKNEDYSNLEEAFRDVFADVNKMLAESRELSHRVKVELEGWEGHPPRTVEVRIALRLGKWAHAK